VYLSENPWRNVELDVIEKSIVGAGFHHNFKEWHITRHDIFGALFKSLWANNSSDQINDFALQEGEADDTYFLKE